MNNMHAMLHMQQLRKTNTALNAFLFHYFLPAMHADENVARDPAIIARVTTLTISVLLVGAIYNFIIQDV